MLIKSSKINNLKDLYINTLYRLYFIPYLDYASNNHLDWILLQLLSLPLIFKQNRRISIQWKL